MRAKAYLMGWSSKKPQPVHHNKADIEYVAGWRLVMEEWLDELKKDGFDACVADQHLVRNDYNPSQGLWSAIGVPIWRYKYSRSSQFYIFGGFTINGHQLFRNIGQYTAPNVLKVVKEMHRKWGQFGLIWDKASQHRACLVTDYLADNASDIRVQNTPTAWPELDPVEGYWSKLVRHQVMNVQYKTVDERTNGIMNAVRCMRPNLDIRKIILDSILVDKKPGETKYYERGTVTEEPPSAAEIEYCKNFMA